MRCTMKRRGAGPQGGLSAGGLECADLGGYREQVKRQEDVYKKEKYVLDQRVADGRRGVEEEELRLASMASPEELDRMAAEHDAAVEELRMEIQVGGGGAAGAAAGDGPRVSCRA